MATASAGLIGDPGLGGATREQYAVDVLHGIGAPITPGNVAAIEIWIAHESGGSTGFAFNPLNSTDHPFGSAGQGGSQGNIQRYQTYAQGVQTIVHQLQYPNHGYPAIVAAFKSNAGTAAILRAVNASDWGTHNFSAAELGTNTTAPVTSTTPSAPGSFTAQTVGFPGGSLLSGAGSLVGPLISLGGSAVGGLGGLIIGGPGDPGSVTTKGAGVIGSVGSAAAGGLAALGAAGAAFVSIITNWKYELEFVIGALMVLLGIRLISADVTGGKVIPRPSPGTAGAVAAAAAA